jgi:microcystin-dependent protein
MNTTRKTLYLRLVAVLITVIVMTSLGKRAEAQGDFPLVGQIGIFAYDFCPDGWIQAAGQILPISEFCPLFVLLGTRYGGDGTTNFALPDLQSPVCQYLACCIALVGIFPPTTPNPCP